MKFVDDFYIIMKGWNNLLLYVEHVVFVTGLVDQIVLGDNKAMNSIITLSAILEITGA